MSCLKSLLITLLPPLLAIAIYANTLENGFVYDDKDTIVNNTFINDLNNLPKMLEKQEYFARSGEATYRPVVTLTYFLDYALYGLKPWGYHLTNVLLHAANTALLYLFLILLHKGSKDLGSRPNLQPLFISLLFATHPILTEAVNAISYREDLLTFLFYMTTLNLYLTLRQTKQNKSQSSFSLTLYIISCLTFLLALLSKEMAITLPLIIYLYEWIYNKKSFHASLLNPYNIGYVIITAFYLYLHLYNPISKNPLGWRIMDRLITVPYLILNYLKLTIFPVSLSADYFIVPIKSLFSSLFLLPSVAIIFLLVAALLMKKEMKGISFGILFFMATLVPVYNIIPITNPLAERYLYLPAAGFCMVICSNFGSRSKTFNLYFFIPFVAMLSIYSIGIVNRNKVWENDYTLWSDTVRKVPQSSRPYNDLGNILYKEGRLEEAVMQYQSAIKLRPDFVEAYNNRGNVLAEMGRFEEAVTQYRAALKFRPDIADIRVNLANLYLTMGRLDDALLEFKTALKLRPDDPQLHHLAGITYNKQGLYEKAMQELRNAIRLQPDNPVFHNDLAITYAGKNMYKEAVGEYQQVLRLNPESMKTYYDLGMVYVRMGLKDEARKEFEVILQRRPDFLPARQALEGIHR